MKQDNEQITPENVEEQIQQAFQPHERQGTWMPTRTRVIRELYMLYHEEAIMDRAWERLIERHPEIDSQIDQMATQPQKIIDFPQRPAEPKVVRKGWRRRVSLLIAVILSLVLIGSTFLLFHQNVTAPTGDKHKVAPATGPLQLLDHQGRLIYQTDGKKTLEASKDQHTEDFVQYALKQLANDLHVKPAQLSKMGLRVTTTLDLDLQGKVYKDAQQQILKLKDTKNITDSAVVVLDYHDGSIRALFGSLNAQQNGAYNGATSNRRSPGSAYKPFVYATAFDQGISPGDVVNDTQTTFPGGYTPMDYGRQYHGLMSYRTALQNGYNVPAVQLLTRTGLAPTLKKVAELGVPSPPASQVGYSMALGATEATVLDTTVAYGTMANQGVHVAPNAIENVMDTNGHLLFQSQTQGTRVLSPAAAFMITDVLSDNAARAPEIGLCSPLVLYTTSQEQCLSGNPGTLRPAAAMLGTTDTFRDNWTVGYTRDYAIGVWSGNDNHVPMGMVTGLDGAAYIWHDAMLLAEQGMPIQQFAGPPATVIKKTITDQGITTTDWHLK